MIECALDTAAFKHHLKKVSVLAEIGRTEAKTLQSVLI